MPEITGYHAHVYFDAHSIVAARALVEAAARALPIDKGRMHEKCVGPHPMWSCQLAFAPQDLRQVLEWLVLNRGELVVFTHPDTGEHLQDHRDRAFWMGACLPLNLSIFE